MMRIAIDGPSGAGKSYLAKALAAHYGYIHVDTGALYRALGLYASRQGIAIERVAEICPHLERISVTLAFSKEGQRVFLCGEDVTALIRTPEISMYASAVSAVPQVRSFLLETQRSIAREHSVIMDGRDIGTVILPDAEVKIFLVADNRARAVRRCAELKEKGIETTVEEVLADMNRRDENDRTRATAPAVAAEDAVLLDNSLLTREETLAAAIQIIEEKSAR
ncbi:MAG: (d)CMP kinase [Clostridia bacterium]|nr:(d)CMP kinase [Clostridia bacterium]